jgi:NAD+ diphosphatase
MFKTVIPFSREIFKNFNFHVKYSETDNNSIVVNINRYNFSFNHISKNLNRRLISFGYSDGQTFFVKETEHIESGNDFRNIISKNISEKERFIAGVAKAVLTWNNNTKFCSSCGNILTFHKTESAKYCEKCKSLFFPKLNPAIIVVIKKENSILLTRKKEWKQDRFGIVAGFIEYGESAEEAVIREVFEETNLKIKNLNYVASQFWPFPYQLMLGFKAEYKSGNLNIDSNELEEAQWFNIENLPILPPKASIARYLIDMVLYNHL